MKTDIKCEFSEDELMDVWRSIQVWQDELNEKLHPATAKALVKLVKKVRKYLGHKRI